MQRMAAEARARDPGAEAPPPPDETAACTDASSAFKYPCQKKKTAKIEHGSN